MSANQKRQYVGNIQEDNDLCYMMSAYQKHQYVGNIQEDKDLCYLMSAYQAMTFEMFLST